MLWPYGAKYVWSNQNTSKLHNEYSCPRGRNAFIRLIQYPLSKHIRDGSIKMIVCILMQQTNVFKQFQFNWIWRERVLIWQTVSIIFIVRLPKAKKKYIWPQRLVHSFPMSPLALPFFLFFWIWPRSCRFIYCIASVKSVCIECVQYPATYSNLSISSIWWWCALCCALSQLSGAVCMSVDFVSSVVWAS